ncbi:MAG: hypothetical protein AAGH41_08800 [Pseudomonadota bacterium]
MKRPLIAANAALLAFIGSSAHAHTGDMLHLLTEHPALPIALAALVAVLAVAANRLRVKRSEAQAKQRRRDR